MVTWNQCFYETAQLAFIFSSILKLARYQSRWTQAQAWNAELDLQDPCDQIN